MAFILEIIECDYLITVVNSRLEFKDVKFSCASFNIREKFARACASTKRLRKSEKWIFDVKFPGNLFGISVFLNNF